MRRSVRRGELRVKKAGRTEMKKERITARIKNRISLEESHSAFFTIVVVEVFMKTRLQIRSWSYLGKEIVRKKRPSERVRMRLRLASS